MADSIRELIIKNLVTTLEGITKTAGYNFTIQKVYRAKMVGLDITEFPSIIVVPTGEVATQEPIERYNKRLSIALECWLQEGDDDITEKVNLLLADVEKALLADYTRGGKAIDTKITGNDSFYNDANKPYGGVIVNVEINYRHKYADPYILG